MRMVCVEAFKQLAEVADEPQKIPMFKVARSSDNHGPTVEMVDKSVVDFLENAPGIEDDDDL